MKLLQKLKEEVLPTNWEPLAPHFARGVLYLLDQELLIEEVGAAMAEDHVSQVKEWLDHGLLYPPTAEQAKSFSDHNTMFDMLIIEPYVLIQQKLT